MLHIIFKQKVGRLNDGIFVMNIYFLNEYAQNANAVGNVSLYLGLSVVFLSMWNDALQFYVK